ncbi:MAG: sugar ABC transporter permease [Lachnospiraceae bacterium]|nr:sugar ABC transporter permease [Lachnospiraceae bacterium]
MQKTLKKYFPVFVLPTAAAFIIGFIVPFVMAVYLSFCSFTTVNDAQFVGFSNYIKAFQDETFVHSIGFSAIFTVVTVILINVLAFTVALCLTQKIKGTNLFRTVFFMPNLIGGIVLGYVWQLLFNGVLAYFNRTLTYSSVYGFWGLVILLCWQQVGYMMILYIAGLQNISSDMLEAAQVDGATGAQRLFRVIIPSVRPTIVICTFMTLTNGFKLFDQNLALTAGEPSRTTEMVALNIYNTFYGSTSTYRGVGQAKAVVFAIALALIGVIQMRFTAGKGDN